MQRKKIEQAEIKAADETRAFPRYRKKESVCIACKQTVRFAWTCSCGFAMCQECMYENLWGMTCNNITWVCPDCGKDNGFGNQ